ncbi:GntR family transcriptional regulator [Flavobacterium hungaricum]|uniref:GntR family transcriptional regulator n=1 Tax=Flavobacterium hungaricum TaxID=2082725 RepID=A0ABR9THX3_9FLAO|nr:GntR family transcriptional regulator [Flavobacterium hungaricum]MBE8724958.1 GntR family transcriptional regulator [Flavobacterium hungaricum]
MNIISIQNNIGLPKYKQIILSIEKAIEDGKLEKGDRLPSVNKVCLAFTLSRDTVLLAYDELKKRGIIYAIPGKGYYVKSTETTITQKIFLLFDELNIFKEDIYNSFLKHIGKNVQVDIFFHHFNVPVFKKLLNDSHGNYTKYIIMPTNLNDIVDSIKTLPVNDVIILDQTNSDLKMFPAIYQNHQKDIYEGLLKVKKRLAKYKKLILIFSGFREPLGMKLGFETFCKDYNFDCEILTDFSSQSITLGNLYIIPNDRDLLLVIENGINRNLQLGEDFGILSYNETALKKIAANGITTISTNFELMGKILADMVLKGIKEQIENKSALILRNSL